MFEKYCRDLEVGLHPNRHRIGSYIMLKPVSVLSMTTTFSVLSLLALSSSVSLADSFFGLPHTALGSAQLTQGTGGHLVVSNIGSSGQDGVSIDLDEGDGLELTLPQELDPGLLANGSFMRLTRTDPCSGATAITTFEVASGLLELSADFSGLGATARTVELYLDCRLVARYPGHTGAWDLQIPGPLPADSKCVTINSCVNGVCAPLTIYEFDDIEASTPAGGQAVIDEVRLIPEGLPPSPPFDLSVVSVQALGMGSFAISDEALFVADAGGLPIRALGQATMTATACHDCLVISNIGSSGDDGVCIDPVGSQAVEITLPGPMDPCAIAEGAFMQLVRKYPASGSQASTETENVGGVFHIVADFREIGSPSRTIEFYRDGILLEQTTGHTGSWDLKIPGPVPAGSKCITINSCVNGICAPLTIYAFDDAEVTTPSENSVVVDQVRFIPETPDPLEPLTLVDLQAADLPQLILQIAEPPKCGDAQHPILPGDTNKDCYVNLFDLVPLSLNWLRCTAPMP